MSKKQFLADFKGIGSHHWSDSTDGAPRMGRKAKFRKTLSTPRLLAQMRCCFEAVEDEVAGRGLSLADCLMSGLAIFALKYPSKLQFEQDARKTDLDGRPMGHQAHAARDVSSTTYPSQGFKEATNVGSPSR